MARFHKYLIVVLSGGCIILLFIICYPVWHSTPSAATALSADPAEISKSDTSLSTSPEPDATQPDERFMRDSLNSANNERETAWRKLLSSTGLPDLESKNILANDIEIRLWELPGLYNSKTKCWFFERKQGQWTAYAFIDEEFNGTIVKIALEKPSFDSSNWNEYVESSATPGKVRSITAETTPLTDSLEIIMEVRFGDDYVKRLIDNDRFLTRLFSMIKAEFFNNDENRWSKH